MHEITQSWVNKCLYLLKPGSQRGVKELHSTGCPAIKTFVTSTIYYDTYPETVAESFPQLTVGMQGLLCFHPLRFVHRAVYNAECHAFKRAKNYAQQQIPASSSLWKLATAARLYQSNCVSSKRKAACIFTTIKTGKKSEINLSSTFLPFLRSLDWPGTTVSVESSPPPVDS